jgi:AAA+ ATPase superfamily predicted ATPase
MYKPMQFTMDKIFPVGVPVTGENLIGREKEIEEIKSLLKIGQSVIVTAPRKFGKTSLILEILNRLKNENNFVSIIDIFGVVTKRHLAEKIVDTILINKKIRHSVKTIKENLIKAMKLVELKQTIQDFEFIIGFSDQRIDEDEILDASLDFPEDFAKKSGKHLFLAFDEFGDLVRLNGDALIKLMRSKFQLHQNVTYLFSGSQESLMEELFSNKQSAFFRFGRLFYLSPIASEAFKPYIKERFNRMEIEIEDAVIEWVLSKTLCHPYYTQLVCQICYLAVKGTKSQVTMRDIQKSYQQAVIFEKSYFEEIESSLMENKYLLLLLRQLALYEGSAYQLNGIDKQYIYKLLVVLQRKGIIKRVEKGKYILIDPLFREYLQLRESGEI